MSREEKTYSSKVLIKRFLPYYKKYIPTLLFDLFCAALTTICEIVLPLIIRKITNAGIEGFSALSVGFILRIGLLYLIL